MYKLFFTESYRRKERKFLRKHPELVEIYDKVIYLLTINPQHPSLRLHKLSGRLAPFHSISITLSYRLIVLFHIQGDTIMPFDIGSHDEVY